MGPSAGEIQPNRSHSCPRHPVEWGNLSGTETNQSYRGEFLCWAGTLSDVRRVFHSGKTDSSDSHCTHSRWRDLGGSVCQHTRWPRGLGDILRPAWLEGLRGGLAWARPFAYAGGVSNHVPAPGC